MQAVQAATGTKAAFVGVAGLGEAADMKGFVAEFQLNAFPHLADVTGETWKRFGIVRQAGHRRAGAGRHGGDEHRLPDRLRHVRAELADAAPTAVSQHLAKLRLAGLVKGRREGTFVYYSAADEHVRRLLTQGLFHADHIDRGEGSLVATAHPASTAS